MPRSVYAAMDLENHWLCGLDTVQVFATGTAAENAATTKGAFVAIMSEKSGERESRSVSCLRNLTENTASPPAAESPATPEEEGE